MEIDTAQLDDILRQLNKDYAGTVRKGSGYAEVERIPTGSLSLDYATVGGIPQGRISRFYGGPSSGKSLAAYNVIREAQTLGLNSAYYNAEGVYSESYARRCGIDVDKLVVVEGSVIEELGNKSLGLMKAVHLHVVDSLSVCVAAADLDKDLEDSERVGINAKTWKRAIRHINNHMDKNKHTFILIDHVFENIGGPPGASPKPGNGVMVGHASSLDLYFRKGQWLYYKDGRLSPDGVKSKTLSGAAEADGIETMIRVDKSRVSRPFRTARVRLDFKDSSYDLTDEYASCAIFFDVVESTAKGRYLLPDGTKIHGAPALGRAIMDHPELKASIEAAVRRAW